MRKLLLGIAAVVSFTSSAMSKQTIISFDGNCNVVTISTQNAQGKSVVSLAESDSCATSVGVGGGTPISGVKYKALGTTFSVAAGTIYDIEIQWPLATGNAWAIYSSGDGINFNFVSNGTYTVVGGAFKGPSDLPPINAERIIK